MQNKILLISLAIGVIIIIGLGWLTHSVSGASPGSEAEAVSLITNPNPLRIGPATFIIDVKDRNGKSVDNATVFFDLNMTGMNMGTQQGNATPQGNGKYAAFGRMSMPGPWRVSIKVTLPDGKVVNKNFNISVP